jgi:outer membrane protein assembly factor BamB
MPIRASLTMADVLTGYWTIRGLVAAGLLAAMGRSAAVAQLGMPGVESVSRYELSEDVEVDRASGTARTYLDRAKEYLADGQWDDAVETLRQVMEESGDQLLAVTDQRYVSVRDFCHLQLVSLPPEALSLYRSRVDPLARAWYERGMAGRDRRLLSKVVEEAFASSWGDDALAALGEMALESGDHGAARAYWEKIVPLEIPEGRTRTSLSVPDTDLDLAAILARLVLVSVLEGSRARAEAELDGLSRMHPDARGRLGGEEVNFVEGLKGLLAASENWPQIHRGPDWPTFAGNAYRGGIAADAVDVGKVAWRVPLRPTLGAVNQSRTTVARVAEDAAAPLSYHPVTSGPLVLVNSQVEIVAFDLESGKPAWGLNSAAIFRDEFGDSVHALYHPANSLGVPRFTMTVHGERLYARMGTSVTDRPRNATSTGGSGYLVCLDLAAQGRLAWKVVPDDPAWAFEGSPIAAGENLYVAMRRSDVRPQLHLACYNAQTGRRIWRSFVCSAETPARGMFFEATHTLLTLDRETVYVNTNLGCVAAVSGGDGRVKWISLYPRVVEGDLLHPPAHRSRDLNPCLFDRGRLLVAPRDNPRILALDAGSGQMLWQTGTELADVVHLLGVSGDNLIATGHRVYWISLADEDAGKVKHVWPSGDDKLGYGRGVLAGDFLYWPTRDKIYVFDHAIGRLRREVPLLPRGIGGGNLLVADGRLLVAGADELVGLDQHGGAGEGARPVLAELEIR